MGSFPPAAWEVITPRGMAYFASAPWRRLFLVQWVASALVSMSVMWCVWDGVFPTIVEAISRLPPTGVMRSRSLEWQGESPILLAEGRILALSVDLNHSGAVRSPAHFQLEFGRQGVLVHSLFGYTEWRYPKGWIAAANRTELGPWWGARETGLLVLTGVLVVIGLQLVWAICAALYMWPARVLAFYANRAVSLGACYRLSAAALMPGALLMALAILFYSVGLIDLIGLGFVAIAHLVVGWAYLFTGVLMLPPTSAGAKRNPFRAD